jgi:hypothetical protein
MFGTTMMMMMMMMTMMMMTMMMMMMTVYLGTITAHMSHIHHQYSFCRRSDSSHRYCSACRRRFIFGGDGDDNGDDNDGDDDAYDDDDSIK